MARSRTTLGALGLLAAASVFAQPRPAFEAANLKVNTSGDRGSSSHGSGSQVIMTNMTLEQLIQRAYNVRQSQVAGPDWLKNAHFDLAAKYPENTKSADRPVMLRTLLEDKFKLAVHHENRMLTGYALLTAKGGFKLKPVEGSDDHIARHGGSEQTLTAKQTSMAAFVVELMRILDAPVVDETGIPGAYDFELHITIDQSGANGKDPDPRAPFFYGLQDALPTIGLRLQPRKVPLDVIVVDHAERTPVDN